MGQFQVRLSDGSVGVAESDSAYPTPQEVEQARTKFEEEKSGLSQKQLIGMEAWSGIPSERTQVMQASDPRDVLMRQAAESARTIQAMQSGPPETVSNTGSGVGAVAGGVAGAKYGAQIGSRLGPYGAAAGGGLGALLGSAVGAAGGKLAGYNIPGMPGVPPTPEEQFKASLDTGYDDLRMNGLFMGAGAAFRTGKNISRAGTRMVTNKVFGFNTPEILERVSEARTLGIRLTPMDISPRVAEVYSSIFSNVPLISGPLRAAQARRATEVAGMLRPIIGPLDSGINEVVLGRNMLAAVRNANTVRKDWYNRIYGEATSYFEQHPEVVIGNDAVDPARRYMYQEARGGLPYTKATTRSATTETTRETASRSQGASGSLVQDSTAAQRSVNAEPPVMSESASQVSRETGRVAASDVRANVRTTVEQSKLESLQAGTFDNPTDVDEFIRSVAGSPDELNYWQLSKLTENMGAAMRVASPSQKRALAQMFDNLDTAVERVSDPAAKQLIVRSRNLHRQVMEFFENPQAQEFVRADPRVLQNVRELRTRKNIPKAMSSELFGALFDDVSVEGVRNISKLIGPNNMKDAVERDVGRRFGKFIKSTSDGAEAIDYQGLRVEFGLNNATNARRAATGELLKSGRYPMDVDKLSKVVDVLEREVGPQLPPLAKMYIRGAALGGPQAALKAFLATRALKMFGGPVGSAAAVLGFRKFSQFLASPERMQALGTVLDPLIKAPGIKNMAARQVLRYVATDLATDKRGGEEPTPDEVNAEYGRVVSTLEEAGYVNPEPRATNPLAEPTMQLRDLWNNATRGER